jgi:hypothetical protein
MRFRVECGSTKPGEIVYIVGSIPELGSWDVAKGVPCSTTAHAFPVWTSLAVPIKSPEKVSFKVVVAKLHGHQAKWEAGDNKEVFVDANEAGSVIVNCAYGRHSVELMSAPGDVGGATMTQEAREEAQQHQHAAARTKASTDANGVDADTSQARPTTSSMMPSSHFPPIRTEAHEISELQSDASTCLKLRLGKNFSQAEVRVVVCGEVASLGSWNPAEAAPMSKADGLWILPGPPTGTKVGTLFKYVAILPGSPPRWENIENRKWCKPGPDVAINIFDSTSNERPKKKLGDSESSVFDFIIRIMEENSERSSYRLKLELPKELLDADEIKSLSHLACLQAYLTWVASGQIACQEDGRHNRPCAAAKAAQTVTRALWELAKLGDAHRFIARRIFPSLPSFADEFTTAVPMTRIRDITHAWPHNPEVEHAGYKSIKLFLKHELQNKLHRCADPGDLVKLDQLLDRLDREGGCGFPQNHINNLKTFQVELQEFFNAAGLDDSARQIAQKDGSLKPAVDYLLWLKS